MRPLPILFVEFPRDKRALRWASEALQKEVSEITGGGRSPAAIRRRRAYNAMHRRTPLRGPPIAAGT